MNVECARVGRLVGSGECSDIIVNTSNNADLRVCRDCQEGQALQFSVGGGDDRQRAAYQWRRTPETPTCEICQTDLSAFSDAELWAELHRRHPDLWKKF